MYSIPFISQDMVLQKKGERDSIGINALKLKSVRNVRVVFNVFNSDLQVE